MRVNYISDLHLEFGDLVLPGGDILILAGDVSEARTLDNYAYQTQESLTDSKRKDRAARFFNEECSKYSKVLYVLGNHEHYHSRLDKTAETIMKSLPKNVQLLEQDSIELNGAIFIGATLWTDLNNNCPLTHSTLRQSMNDYRCITFHDRANSNYRKLNPADTYKIFKETVEYFKKTLEQNKDKPIVIVTHHAPSHLSIHPKYQNDTQMNGGFASDLSNLILDNPQIKYWLHGHTHHSFDYQLGDCRVLCNPRGYNGYEEQALRVFDPTRSFEI